MQLNKLTVNMRCDMPLCGNSAAYSIGADSGSERRIFICESCMKKLYEQIGKLIVPKSPDNIIKTAVKRREENEKRQ